MSRKITRINSSKLTKIKNQQQRDKYKASSGSKYIRQSLSIDEMVRFIQR